ncbi:MAG: YuzB family protein [Gorillibacterium sp.]|nr:YuzB family protein [Gorillibacterium sp.]
MRPIIEFCASNMHNGTDIVLKQLEINSAYDVIEYGCLGNCGQCFAEPYALVNGELVPGDSANELYAAILSKIAELEALDQLFADCE